MVSSPAVLDMEKICRVCMKSDVDLFLLFDEKYSVEKSSLAAILSECTMYKVNRYDELPHQMCGSCMENAKSAFSFKRSCEQAYRILVGMLTEDEAPPSHIKVETDTYAEKSTQTEDSTMYPCERCDQKFFTFDALRTHREQEHKGSAIVCRFCSKTFNRVGYLRTHIAVFHPESGYTSHNQCNICKRQFTRREHMRRHLAVIHKIVEIIDTPELEEDETSKSEMPDLMESEICLHENDKMMEKMQFTNHSFGDDISIPPDNMAGIMDNLNDSCEQKPTFPSDDEDNKPLSDFLMPSKNFVEILIDESRTDYKIPDGIEDVSDIKSEVITSPTEETLEVDALTTEQHDLNSSAHTSNEFPASSPSASEEEEGEDAKEFKCKKCDKTYRRRATLERHLLTHKEDKQFPCKICPKSFTRADFLKNHMNSKHNAAKVMKCDECDLEFTHITQFKRHKETKHGSKLHKCEVCQKSFTTKLYMQRHMASHGKKRYVCKECGEKFLSRDELNAHIKAEGHDRPLLCPECGLRCKTSNILTVHMRRHKGEKPYKCKFCSKGFPRTDDLRLHEKYHTGEKSHFCETCGKGFQRKYNLTIHMRVHTGEKPYKCPHCPHAFTQSNDLKSHIRRHTGERFRCDICGAPFLQGYQIRQHKLAEHGVKEEPPTQRVEKYTSPEEQELQIKQNLQRELAKTMNFDPFSHSDSTQVNSGSKGALEATSSNVDMAPAPNAQSQLNFLNI